MKLHGHISTAALLLGAILSVGVSTGHAEQAQPERVDVGVYLVDISNVDQTKCTYTANFYIWFRWRGKVDPRNFEIMNG